MTLITFRIDKVSFKTQNAIYCALMQKCIKNIQSEEVVIQSSWIVIWSSWIAIEGTMGCG